MDIPSQIGWEEDDGRSILWKIDKLTEGIEKYGFISRDSSIDSD